MKEWFELHPIISRSIILVCLNLSCSLSLGDSNLLFMNIPQAMAKVHQQEFTITAAQRNLGHERFYKETELSHVILKGQVHLQDIGGESRKPLHIKSELILDQQYHPQKYHLVISKGQYNKSLDVRLQKGKAFYKSKENGKTKSGSIEISPNSVVLDNNVFHHYTALIERYRFHQGGLQRFDVFVPSQLLKTFAELSLSLLEEEAEGGACTISMNLGNMVDLILELDANREITKIEIPLQEVVVSNAHQSSPVAISQYSLNGSSGHRVVDRAITIPIPRGKITGSLTMPAHCHSPFPAIVLVSGSGIQSKDGPFGLYRQIGFSLSELGFAVLRLNDNGAGETRIENKEIFTAELIAIRAAIRYLKSHPEVHSKKIILLGHSAGGIIASHIVGDNKDVQALVLLAMPAIPIFELLREQMGKIKEKEMRKLLKRQMATMKKYLDSKKNVIETGFSWMRVPELRKYLYESPQEILSVVKIPVLIVQGDKDERVPAQHAYRLKNSLLNGHSRNALRVFKGLNHFFFRNTELSYEIDQGVMSFVADWITNSLLIDVCQKEVRNGR